MYLLCSIVHSSILTMPPVSLIGIGILWGLAIWCMANPEGSRAEFIHWQQQSA
jgi:hypothetical protein